MTRQQKSRPKLTRGAILTAGVSMADGAGIEALSMRLLAKELGFGVMSLYNHVTDKEDLLDGMVELVAQEIELPPQVSADWKQDLRACAISAYRMFMRHRWASALWSRWPGPTKNRYHDGILRVLRTAGFPESLACQGFHALTMHVVGFAMQVVDMPFSNREELVALGQRALTEVTADAFPHLAEHIEYHLAGRDDRNDFKFMLDLILDGLERDFAALS